MKIISLQTENIKCLRAVEISPDGKNIQIVGKNGAGKSSVLDAIEYALRGRQYVCERPIRDGQSSAKSVLELDDYTVTRTFTASGGGTLKVEARNPLPGTVAKLSSPQAVLDDIIGTLTFDPLAFTRLESVKQADVLRKLVGIDTTALDEQHAKFYASRTDINRQLSNVNSKIGNQVINDTLPLTEIDAKDIITARAEAAKQNDRNTEVRKNYGDIVYAMQQTSREMVAALINIESLEKQLAAAKAKHNLLSVQHATLEDQRKAAAEIVAPPTTDLTSFDKQLLDAQQTNFSIRANNELRVQFETRAGLMRQSGELTKRLDDIVVAKAKQIADAKYPIQSLGFSSTGTVTFSGLPFEQISTAQRLKISAAIGIALNPKLRVMMIRDGSMLDEDTLAELINIAANNDTQLWIERVGKLSGELPGVVIEDGSVVESTLPQIPEAADSKNTDCV